MSFSGILPACQCPLNPHAVDTHPGIFYLLNQRDAARPLGWLLIVVIIVIQFRFGRGLLGQPKGFRHEIIAQVLQENRFAHRPIFVQRFVDDIPRENLAVIPTGDSFDVVRKKRLNRILAVDAPDERRQLTVPDQRMAVDFDVVLFAKRHQLVGHLEIVRVPARMNQRRFHDVFGRSHVELAGDKRRCLRVPLVYLGVVQRRADAEILLECLPQ